MALVLPHSIFFHVGRTAGHSVRKTIRAMGIPTYDVGAFHDWPSNIPLSEEEQRKVFFCFVRHPLAWLKSFWCHEMQFGWSESDYTRNVQSDTFAEFLEKSIAAYPQGPVMEIFRPFISQCQEVGRQENLEADLGRILERAGERIVPGVLDRREVTTVGVDRRIADSATAPQALLEKVLKTEREICERFGYADIPRSLIGPEQVCLATYVQLGTSKHPFTADADVTLGIGNGFVLNGQSYPSVSRSPTLTMAIQRTLAQADLAGKAFIDVCCEDGVFCFFAEAKAAADVVGVTRGLRSVTANLKAALDSRVSFLKHGCYGVEQAIGRKFDVVLSWGHFHLARYPLLMIRTLSQLMKDGGTLVLSTQYLDAFPGVPLMYAPVGSESPIRAEGCSFFNREGLENALASYGFHDFKVCESLPMGASKSRDFARMPFDTDRVYHDSESALGTMVMTCRWSPAAADRDARYVIDRTTGQSLMAWWDSELPTSGLPDCVTNNEMLTMLDSQVHRHREAGRRLQEELQVAVATVQDREKIIQDTRRDLITRTEELDQTREELVGRTAELDRARDDLVARTEELDQVRYDLVDRTARLEQHEETVRRLTAELAEARRALEEVGVVRP